MARGPKPKSGELAELQGNPGHRAVITTPDAVEPIAETAPDFVRNAEARRIWSHLMPQLRGLRFVKSTDEIAVGRYCLHLARFIALDAKIEAENGNVTYTTNTLHGSMERLHPNFAAMMRIEEALVKIEDRIGMSPAARQSLLTRIIPAGSEPPTTGLTDPRTQPAQPQSPLTLFSAASPTPNDRPN
jgi:P27 family predicted phage terminase small subunit